MTRIYTQIASGGSSTADLVDPLRDAILRTSLGSVWTGDLVQINMGYSTPDDLFKKSAEEILEHAPNHPESLQTQYVRDGQEIKTAGFRGIARSAIEKAVKPVGMFINFEDRKRDDGQPTFDDARRRITPAEVELVGRCRAVAVSEVFTAADKAIPISVWNTPINPFHEDVNWDHVRETHDALGLDYAILNGYRDQGSHRENAEYIAGATHLMSKELPGTRIIVALSPSTQGRVFSPLSIVTLLHKLYAIDRAECDVLLWMNAAWSSADQNKQSIKDFAEVVGSFVASRGRRI